MDPERLSDAAGHFAFGENWASYAAQVSEFQRTEGYRALAALLGRKSLTGSSFLDIGSGSGLHSLAALELGAKHVLALDVDSESVATTRRLLAQYAPADASYEVRLASILSSELGRIGDFDIVYSWGVLHHTGRMREAIKDAAGFVRPGGVFAFALYRKTLLCPLWKLEKRIYANAPNWLQSLIRGGYVTLFRLCLTLAGRSFRGYVDDYSKNRGMDFYHDAHDWLGGWPYESISPPEVDALMSKLGFTRIRANLRHSRLITGCDEYVYQRYG